MNAQASTRSRTRDPERTRAAIVAAAAEEFAEKGFQGARTGAIAKKAGVPQGLIYHYFEGKEELFDAVLEDCLNPYFEATAEMLEQAHDHLAESETIVRVDVPPKGATTNDDGTGGVLRPDLESIVPAMQSGSLFGSSEGVLLVDCQNLLKAEADIVADLLANLAADIAYAWLDPRVRDAEVRAEAR